MSQAFVGHPMADFGAVWWGILERRHDALGQFLTASGIAQEAPDFERHALAWTFMAPDPGKPDLGDAVGIGDPDELARRWFGGHHSSSSSGSSATR